jgi:transcriptional regulator with XRE-family HTH domain
LGIDPFEVFSYSESKVKKTLADRLAFLISDLGVRQQDFARRIQYSQPYICMILNGTTTDPGRRFIDAICREFNVNPEWLVNGREPVFTIPGMPMPPEKAEILAKFLMLSEERQKVIGDIIKSFLVSDMIECVEKESEPKKQT